MVKKLFKGFFYDQKLTGSGKVRIPYPGSEKVSLLNLRGQEGLKSFASRLILTATIKSFKYE